MQPLEWNAILPHNCGSELQIGGNLGDEGVELVFLAERHIRVLKRLATCTRKISNVDKNFSRKICRE
jgi:hypothetical protein